MTFSAQETNKIRKKGLAKDSIFVTPVIDGSTTEYVINLGYASNKVAVQADGNLNYNILHSLNGVDFESDMANQNVVAPNIVPVATASDHPVTSIKITRNSGSGKIVVAAIS